MTNCIYSIRKHYITNHWHRQVVKIYITIQIQINEVQRTGREEATCRMHRHRQVVKIHITIQTQRNELNKIARQGATSSGCENA